MVVGVPVGLAIKEWFNDIKGGYASVGLRLDANPTMIFDDTQYTYADALEHASDEEVIGVCEEIIRHREDSKA